MQITEIVVTLDDVDPKVRRGLDVPADLPLDRLHLTLQAAFGWHNAHLYQFCIGEPYVMGAPRWVMPDFADDPEDLPADKTTLAEAIAAAGSAGLTYLYDFGDDWIHRIRIGRSRDGAPGETCPRLTQIAGACPPEDVGGPPGYEMFAEAMADPGHPEHADLKAWYGGSFDPHAPDADRLRAEVRKLAERWTAQT